MDEAPYLWSEIAASVEAPYLWSEIAASVGMDRDVVM